MNANIYQAERRKKEGHKMTKRYLVQEQMSPKRWRDVKAFATLEEAKAFACDHSATSRVVKLTEILQSDIVAFVCLSSPVKITAADEGTTK